MKDLMRIKTLTVLEVEEGMLIETQSGTVGTVTSMTPSESAINIELVGGLVLTLQPSNYVYLLNN